MQHELALAAVQAALQPDPPDDEVVRAQAGEDVPPAVAFEQRSPWEQDGVSGAAEVGAKGIVQNPNRETCEKEGDAFGVAKLALVIAGRDMIDESASPKEYVPV